MSETTGSQSATVQPATGDLSYVWQPLQIGPVTVKNRVMVPARILNWATDDHVLSDRHIAHFRQIADGGTALIVTEQHGAYPQSTGSFYRPCSAWEKQAVPRFRLLADTVHEHGAKSFVQLFGTGVHDKGTMIVDDWHALWGASQVPSVVHGETPFAMDAETIREVVRCFGASAENVRSGGLDGVEVHGAHAYLVGQFLSPTYNDRTDAYGGSPRGRCRLAMEIGKEIRDRVGGDLAVGIRLSLDEFLGEAGITVEEGAEQVAILAETGLFDYFSISGGSYHTLHMAVAPMSMHDGHLLPLARQAKEIIGDRAKVFAVGRVRDLRLIETAVAQGVADMVAMGRAHFADPQIVRKTWENREHEIIRCTGVNECIGRAFDQQEVICMMNPVTGRERVWGPGTLTRVADSDRKRVTVVGGGPGGMKFAEVAARRGYRVTLLEEDETLGGNFNLISRFPTRGGWEVAADNLRRAVANAGVTVRLQTRADRDLLLDEAPDVTVVATGSRYDMAGRSAFRPDRKEIPGVGSDRVVGLKTAAARALESPEALGRKVVILDESGTYLPLGLAQVLAGSGSDVEVVSPQMFVGADTYRQLDLFNLYPALKKLGVQLSAQQMIESIHDDGTVEVHDIWSGDTRTIEGVSCVVLALHRLPDDELFHEIQDVLPEVHRVGDCLAPRKPAAVIYEAEKLAREI